MPKDTYGGLSGKVESGSARNQSGSRGLGAARNRSFPTKIQPAPGPGHGPVKASDYGPLGRSAWPKASTSFPNNS